MKWTKSSWRNKKALQQPSYPNPDEYNRVLSQLRTVPPLVFPGEVDVLKQEIKEAGEGKRFILQGGDCSERFLDCTAENITNKLKILLQMSVILTHASRKAVVRIGRLAGQYAKPRSSGSEQINGSTVPTYRGDSINGFLADERDHDPRRLLQSFHLSAVTLNYIRAMIDGGFADLHHPYSWNLHAIEKSSRWPEYKTVVENILDAIHFMETFGGVNSDSLGRIEFYTSHEGLHLAYEEAMTREIAGTQAPYNLGAHMLWIGERTRDISGAHAEYFRGIANPIGIKAGSRAIPEDVAELCRFLNPANEGGRITLITRLGAANTSSSLPGLIKAIEKSRVKVTWSCDPMHGNTVTTAEGFKTRSFDRVLEELECSFHIHRKTGSHLSGVHFELTGEDVTECTGGATGVTDLQLKDNYTSACDPRLNYTQSLEMALLISQLLKS
jgi:3-deoxy-7-phosphoheptulonate synthase